MTHTIVGLGNPGGEYENTRHNIGRMFLECLAAGDGFSDWDFNKKKNARESEGKLGRQKVILVEPETFMNKSGNAVKAYVKSKKDIERMIVVYDDLDLPLGRFKISFGRSSGGHNGLESIIKNVKTKDFARLRVGISPETPGGKLKKPSGEKAVIDFILGKFKPAEMDMLKKEFKKMSEAVEMVVMEGREKAMGEYNH